MTIQEQIADAVEFALIEQLGGYEIKIPDDECYQYHREQLETYESTKHLSVFGMTEFRATLVRSALLQYRRAHNIYEVGDLIVKTNPKIKHAHVRVVISTSPSGGAVLDYQGFPYKFPCVRHATDEEIKAGRRL